MSDRSFEWVGGDVVAVEGTANWSALRLVEAHGRMLIIWGTAVIRWTLTVANLKVIVE